MGDSPFVRTFLDWRIIRATLPRMLTEGVSNTLFIALLAIAVGVLIGLSMSMLLLSRRWWLRLPARAYVDVFRGLPTLLTVLLIGVGLPAAGFRPFGQDPYGYAVLAIGIISGSYLAEIFRSGIQSIEPGQMQAARSLGMSYAQAMRLVVVPQGIRRVLPAVAGQFVKDIKDSSLVYLLGLSAGQQELFSIAFQEQARTYNSSPLIAAGMCYLAITVPLTHGVNRLDRWLREGRAVQISDPLDDDRLPPAPTLDLGRTGEAR